MKRPELDPAFACARVQELVMDDPHADGAAIIAACKVYLLAIRNPVIGTYNDTIAGVFTDQVDVIACNGNTDPSRFGWNAIAGKDIALLRCGIWPMIQGHHNGVPKRFRQPTPTQSAIAGLPRVFRDQRALGHYDVLRVHKPKHGEPDRAPLEERGLFNINFHPGGTERTGSAGCLTVPPVQYDPLRDALYAAMAAAEQLWLPVILVDKL